ncbi:MAG: tRNA lysidine(34) synthetase TilS [Comamonas sp.]
MLAVAYSGGADSTAVLYAARRAWPGPLVALHVHHGLQAAADGFEQHCRAQCAALGVQLAVAHVDARHAGGQSPEEQARRHRYAALARQARQAGAACVALGQHADDQAETLLLALGRGAGLAGLAAMPAGFERHGVRFERPLLTVPAARIRADLDAAAVPFVRDPSNADLAYTRNRIRLQVLPAIEAAFPAFRETFARSARHAAQAQELLDELARDDLLRLGDPPAIEALRALSAARQANALRGWLKQAAGSPGSAAQLEALLKQVAACRTRGHRIHLRIAHGHVLREGAHLVYRASLL